MFGAKPLLAAAVAVFIATGPVTAPSASAQDIGPALDPGSMVGWAAGNHVLADNRRRERAAASGPSFRALGQATRSSAAPREVSPAALVFRPSTAVRQRNQQQFLQRLSARDPQGASDLRRAFTQRNLMGEIDKLMRSMGLNPASVPDAIGVYLVTAWYGTRGSTDSKPAEFKAVSRQMARSIAATPSFAGASDAVKQEIAEAMEVQAALIDQSVTAAQKQPAAMPRVKNAIAQGARSTFGFDLAHMQLGPEGLQ